MDIKVIYLLYAYMQLEVISLSGGQIYVRSDLRKWLQEMAKGCDLQPSAILNTVLTAIKVGTEKDPETREALRYLLRKYGRLHGVLELRPIRDEYEVSIRLKLEGDSK